MTAGGGRSYCWYGELTLLAGDYLRLRDPGLEPDPLSPVAHFFSTLDHERGEDVKFVLDFWPIDPVRLVAYRKRQLDSVKRGRIDLDKDDLKWLEGTTSAINVAFRWLIKAEAPSRRRARELVSQAATLFVAYTNGTKQALVLAKRARVRQRKYARWCEARPGETRAPRSGWIPAETLGGIIKPASRMVEGAVLRSASLVGLPPRDLGQFEAVDLREGRIAPNPAWIPWAAHPHHSTPGRERILVVSERDTNFTWTGGRSGFGKSATSEARFVYLARAGHGCLFLDPHSDAVNELKPYLAPVADRVVELALDSSQPTEIAAWNPFDLPSEWTRGGDEIPASQWRAEIGAAEALIRDMYFGYQRWHETKETRAGPMFAKAVSALLNVCPLLPRELRPTLFNVIDMLQPDDYVGFRKAVVGALTSEMDKRWWNTSFERESGGDLVPARPLEYLLKSPLIRSYVGSSVAGYRMSELMDQKKVVLVRLGGNGQREREFLASVVVYDILTAMRQRRDNPDVASRSTFHVFLDEVPDYDEPLGNALRDAINQYRKFGLRVHLISQYIDAMQKSTKGALAANRTHLMSSVCDQGTARWFLKETGNGKMPTDVLTNQSRYSFVTEVSQKGDARPLFNCGGLTLETLFGSPPNVPGLQERIDQNSNLRSTANTARDLESRPKDIAKELEKVQRSGEKAGFDEDQNRPTTEPQPEIFPPLFIEDEHGNTVLRSPVSDQEGASPDPTER